MSHYFQSSAIVMVVCCLWARPARAAGARVVRSSGSTPKAVSGDEHLDLAAVPGEFGDLTVQPGVGERGGQQHKG